MIDVQGDKPETFIAVDYLNVTLPGASPTVQVIGPHGQRTTAALTCTRTTPVSTSTSSSPGGDGTRSP